MPSIVEKKIRDKKKENATIDEKIRAEQIKPTVSERKSINEIIQAISDQYKTELSNEKTDKDALNERIKKTIYEEIAKLPVDYEKKRRLEKLAITNIIGLGPIQQYLDNPDITEVIVQRYDNICIEKGGRIYSVKGTFTDEQHLKNVINRILQPVSRR